MLQHYVSVEVLTTLVKYIFVWFDIDRKTMFLLFNHEIKKINYTLLDTACFRMKLLFTQTLNSLSSQISRFSFFSGVLDIYNDGRKAQQSITICHRDL